MKKLKKVFLVCLFSFICLGFTKVSAETFTFEYKDSINSDNNLIMQYLQDYNLSSQDIIEQCNSLHSSYGNRRYYACTLNIDNYLENGISYKKLKLVLYTWDSTNKFDSVSFVYVKDYSTYWVHINSSDTSSSVYTYDFRFNNTTNSFNNTSSSTNYGNLSIQANKSGSILKGGFNLGNLVYTNIDYLGSLSWPIIDKNSKYYDSINLIINNETYGTSSNSNLPFYMFNTISFNEWLGISYEKLNDLGTFENSNVITYKINDEEVGTDKELKIKFTFLNQLDVNANDITIYKYGSQVLTEYLGTTCNNENSDTICEFNLKYNVYDSVDDKLMFDFKFNNAYNVKIEDNIDGSGVYSNHKNVEFEIKNINLKEKSGVLFYLRNYDFYEYLKDYYSEEELGFSFYSSHPSNMLMKNVIYPHDIRYKNTYFFLDENSNYNIYTESMNKLNNFDYFSVNFMYDKNLLLENKYSAFYISNPNYLGVLDTDNQDLYITYNSSLFNYSVSNVVYNNGSGTFLPGVSFDSNIDFTVNGSQGNVESNPDMWIPTEFDEEIKVQYKRGLEYFKDKIIDMFEFVSEFYNTMPEKFRVAFSLIFVLLIGIALFRLLL